MANKEIIELPFEVALGELEQIVRTMEAGELSLDDMITKFEKGTELSNICKVKLESLEKKIQVLVNNNGKAEWEKFNPVNHRVNKPENKTAPAETASNNSSNLRPPGAKGTTIENDDYKEPEKKDLLF